MNCAMCGIHACKNRLENAPKNCLKFMPTKFFYKRFRHKT